MLYLLFFIFTSDNLIKQIYYLVINCCRCNISYSFNPVFCSIKSINILAFNKLIATFLIPYYKPSSLYE